MEIQYFVLNNGCTGYLPTEDEFDEGGYEVYWSMLIYYIYYKRVFPLNRNSAKYLLKQRYRMLQNMNLYDIYLIVYIRDSLWEFQIYKYRRMLK